jgi:hypothetical protein
MGFAKITDHVAGSQGNRYVDGNGIQTLSFYHQRKTDFICFIDDSEC